MNKKLNCLVITLITILSLLSTFLFAKIFSIYNFGDKPTILTFFYLVSIFSLFEYIFLTSRYIIKSLINKKKIGIKKIISLTLFFIALLLILGFLIILNIDWLNWYMNSSPFYINVIVRSLEFVLPSIILIVVGIFLFKKK